MNQELLLAGRLIIKEEYLASEHCIRGNKVYTYGNFNDDNGRHYFPVMFTRGRKTRKDHAVVYLDSSIIGFIGEDEIEYAKEHILEHPYLFDGEL